MFLFERWRSRLGFELTIRGEIWKASSYASGRIMNGIVPKDGYRVTAWAMH